MRVATLAVILLAAPVSAQQPASPAPREMLILGSSSVNGALGRTIEYEIDRLGVRVTRHARSSSGFARPDFHDWEAEIANLGSLARYDVILVIAGGNDTQHLRLRRSERPSRAQQWVDWSDEQRWREHYRGRVQAFVDALCAGGARHVVFLLPLDGGRPGWGHRILRIREEQELGSSHSCGQPMDAAEYPTEVFESLDGVHLNREGARRVWDRVGAPLRRLLGLG